MNSKVLVAFVSAHFSVIWQGDTVNKNELTIETNALRVEFEGTKGPTRLLVPLVVPVGTHQNVNLRIKPRSGVRLRNEVETGDTLNATLSRAHTTSVGGSFFASASHGRSYGIKEKPYEVVSLPDFSGIRFNLKKYTVHDEPVGLLLSFPIESYNLFTAEDYFAEIILEQAGKELQKCRVSREVHPEAGKILLLTGYSEQFHKKIYGTEMNSHLSNFRRSFLEFSSLTQFGIHNLRSLASSGYDGIHLYTNVDNGTILVNDNQISPDKFFREINGLGIKFIYIDTCNSVQVISSFRRTDIHVLIAATENLYDKYGNEFESIFYDALGAGEYISVAFQNATNARGEQSLIGMMRSRKYDPMFLDLKTDCRFGKEDA